MGQQRVRKQIKRFGAMIVDENDVDDKGTGELGSDRGIAQARRYQKAGDRYGQDA